MSEESQPSVSDWVITAVFLAIVVGLIWLVVSLLSGGDDSSSTPAAGSSTSTTRSAPAVAQPADPEETALPEPKTKTTRRRSPESVQSKEARQENAACDGRTGVQEAVCRNSYGVCLGLGDREVARQLGGSVDDAAHAFAEDAYESGLVVVAEVACLAGFRDRAR